MENQDPIRQAIQSEMQKHAWSESFTDPDVREAAFSAALKKKLKEVKGILAINDGKIAVMREDIPEITAVDAKMNNIELSSLALSVMEENKFSINRAQHIVVTQGRKIPENVQRQIEEIDKQLNIKP